MLKDKVTELLNAALEEKPTVFLIELAISGENKITVTLDGDQGVNLQDCIDISRAIEHNLDREEIDFSLEVASAGACSPLKFPRQYKKNIGRKLEVITTEGNKMIADITDATDEFVVLEWSSREPKKIGKGKETVNHRVEVPYSEIKEAKVIIVF
ncbi:MAG TPA: ribosome assembly cofactor RimP [Flavobacterium sp.]|nr:ribosome assembly cofactor RimP [Flavobacterium sp.]